MHPFPELAQAAIGAAWVFLMLMATITFFDQLAKELRR